MSSPSRGLPREARLQLSDLAHPRFGPPTLSAAAAAAPVFILFFLVISWSQLDGKLYKSSGLFFAFWGKIRFFMFSRPVFVHYYFFPYIFLCWINSPNRVMSVGGRVLGIEKLKEQMSDQVSAFSSSFNGVWKISSPQ
ncbi:hypothetical protein CDAR_497221 [Caerostris darwini]|uniref:Uncharacterized protein n=1 Tax=Caerostris darwini TaxID=1538125 RepID=A0AAV4S0R4_9ARAC|nr:hypothetical protein CDAR_497221 [Caerostris darwini]